METLFLMTRIVADCEWEVGGHSWFFYINQTPNPTKDVSSPHWKWFVNATEEGRKECGEEKEGRKEVPPHGRSSEPALKTDTSKIQGLGLVSLVTPPTHTCIWEWVRHDFILQGHTGNWSRIIKEIFRAQSACLASPILEDAPVTFTASPVLDQPFIRKAAAF